MSIFKEFTKSLRKDKYLFAFYSIYYVQLLYAFLSVISSDFFKCYLIIYKPDSIFWVIFYVFFYLQREEESSDATPTPGTAPSTPRGRDSPASCYTPLQLPPTDTPRDTPQFTETSDFDRLLSFYFSLFVYFSLSYISLLLLQYAPSAALH